MSVKLVWMVAVMLGIGLLTLIGPTVANSGATGVGNCYSAQESPTPTLCE